MGRARVEEGERGERSRRVVGGRGECGCRGRIWVNVGEARYGQ